MNSSICPKIAFVKYFIAALITCKSDEDLNKKSKLSSGQHFPKSMRPSRRCYSHANSLKRPNSNLSKILCLYSLSASLMKNRSKLRSLSSSFPHVTSGQHFPHYISTGVFVCVEVLRPSQPSRVMSSAVSLPNHTFTGQA